MALTPGDRPYEEIFSITNLLLLLLLFYCYYYYINYYYFSILIRSSYQCRAETIMSSRLSSSQTISQNSID